MKANAEAEPVAELEDGSNEEPEPAPSPARPSRLGSKSTPLASPRVVPASWKSFSIPSVAKNGNPIKPTDVAGDVIDNRRIRRSTGKPYPASSESDGDDDGSGRKLDLRQSAELVRAGLKEFRASRAAEVWRFAGGVMGGK